ncbi:MAG: FprA family A-type flavoprotein [Tenuifilaceae bacterium]|jgi:flavorubredoxin|uniref:FprA family A-type flavoprotein n=1 Tax=Perlabentimonas gracilis TaxID=2715279 RepID=UPI00140B261F|nr:FprA family A-type flavoprotein [Perlabentimonas gracilis]MDX9770161.1 FprA family A-type flavoprotein [Tenuifilaceae bacterium]NHB67821.1 FprA family A-type flavoprotein [Perlabentimonas gracilis]
MHYTVPVKGKVHWIGVNDRRKTLFENMWTLERGVSYNSYLIVDDKTALVDTIEDRAAGNYIERIEKLLDGRKLDYLIINHMEPDHSGEVKAIFDHFEGVTIVGNVKTFKMVEAYWGITDRLLKVDDGDELSLGHHKLKFVMTPWVHWPETMMTYDTTEQILFSGDAFGSFGTLDGGIFDDEINFDFFEEEMRRYYSNIVGPYSNMVQKAFAKLSGVPVSIVAPVHGPVWRDNPQKVLDLYNRWSLHQAEEGVVIVVASMYGNTELMADYIGRRLAENGIKNIRIHDVSRTHISHLINEIWKYKGLVLGSCAYNGHMFPLMESLTREIIHMKMKDKFLGIFGSYSWNGGGVKNLMKFAEESGFDLVADPAEIYGKPSDDKYAQCDVIAKQMALKLKG